MNNVILSVHGLSFSYSNDGEWILKNLTFDLKAGSMLGIMGPNGGGKSTLLSLLMGEYKANQGEIYFDGEILKGKEHLKYISYLEQVDQGGGFFPLTVDDVLSFAQFKNPQYKKNLDEICHKLELTSLTRSLYRELSGGQKQRTLLARAFLENPTLLILDEPTKGLDAKGQDQLLSLIRSWSLQSDKRSAIIVDHNISHLLAHCDRIMCLNRHAHWHDSKDKFNTDILNDVYHCEYEHLLIHEKGGHTCS